MNGYIKLQRDIFEWCDKNISKGDRKEFSKREALIWLMIHTSYNGDLIDYNEKKLDKGESKNSLEFLASIFGWNEMRVQRFLTKLGSDEIKTIERIGDKGEPWKIKFINWEKYQESGKKSVTQSVTPSVTQSVTQSVTDNSLINIGVTEGGVTPSVTPSVTQSVTQSVNNTSNNDSSLRSSSYITPGNNNTENNNTPSLPLGGPGGAAVFPVFSEEKGQGPSGVYQPKPVEPTVYQTSQSFPLKEVKEPFSVDEVCRRLSDKFINFGAEHRALIEAKYSFIRKNGFVKKMDNTLWTIDGFIIWMSDELEKKGLLAKKNSSGVISRNGKRYVDSSQEGLDYLRSLGVKVF